MLEEKESYRWVKALETSTACLPEGVKVITVCDREGDMYELLDAAETDGQLFLIRVAQNRITVENKRILDAIREKRCMGGRNNDTAGFSEESEGTGKCIADTV